MSFDVQKFRDAKFKFREEKVDLAGCGIELQKFFDDDEPGVFVVRNLSGHEVGISNEAVKMASDMGAVVEKVLSQVSSEKAKGVGEIFGIGKTTADDVITRITKLKLGCVDPVLTHTDCVRIAEYFAYALWVLTIKIDSLTGMGSALGE